MLRNVLEDYLDVVKEREFYYPFSALLHAMGFYDIHITDGGREFGKDFIAKRCEEDVIYQYVIQAKKGDIKQADFRNNIMGQLMEAVVLRGLSHPQLDKALPQRTVLMTTGELIDNAFVEMNELNNRLENKYKEHPVEFWGKNRLVELAEEFGLTGLHHVTAKDAKSYAQFFLTFSKASDGTLSDRDIEMYSRNWLLDGISQGKRVLRASVEADIIASKVIENGRLYEGIKTYMALSRLICHESINENSPNLELIYSELVKEEILPLCREMIGQFRSDWYQANRSLVHICAYSGPFPIVHYLVWCSRIVEILSLFILLCAEDSDITDATQLLIEFTDKETGVGHIPGDRYAVTIAWCCIALWRIGEEKRAIDLIKKSAVWVCNQAESRFGVPYFDANESAEVRMLVGFPFDFIDVPHNRSSFLATVLTDLAALLGQNELYSDLVNDFSCCEIAYNYWQFGDSTGVAVIEAEDCVVYPNIPHAPSVAECENGIYAEHIRHEPERYSVVKQLGNSTLLLLSLFLQDRYFPKYWWTFLPSQSVSEPAYVEDPIYR